MDYIARRRSLESKVFFSVSFHNQDIFYAELESISEPLAFGEKLRVVSTALEALIHRELLIVHLEDTKMTPERIGQLVALLSSCQAHIKKLGIVGIHGLSAFRLKRALRKGGLPRGLGWKVIDDFQAAKEWMVSAQTA